MGMEYFIRFMTKQGRVPLANGKELSECNLWYQAKLCDQTRGLIADLSNPQYQTRPVVFTSEQRAYAFDQLRVLLSEFMEKTDCVSEVLYDDVIQYHELPQLVFEDHTVGTCIEVGVDDQIGYDLCIIS